MSIAFPPRPSLPAPLLRDCPSCRFMAWGQRADLTARESRQFNDRIEHRRPKKRSEYLNQAGAALTSLYVIHSGFLRTSITDGDGREQITGFFMPGELIGMEAIATGMHPCNTTALEDSSVCGMAFADFEQLNRDIPALQHHFHRAMGTEITRDHGMMLLLGAMRAEQRVAVFLLNLSKRFAAGGYSEVRFRLPMTRQEIGNYLGLKTETVSRAFSHFDSIQVIAVHGKDIEIRDLVCLQQLIRDPV